MWQHHLSNLLSRAWQNLVSALSSSNLSLAIFSFTIPISVFVVIFIYKWLQARKTGRNAKDVLWETAVPTFIAGGITAFAWICLFGWSVGATIYQDHQSLVGANGRLAKENERLRKPSINTGDSEKQKRFTIRTELGRLLARNNEIREKCESDKPPLGFSCEGEWIRWRDDTRDYILKNMEPSYLARFKATTGTHMEYKTTSGRFLGEKESNAVNLLTFSGGTLG